MPTAVLIDGGFFLKAYQRCYPGAEKHSPKEVARTMHELACRHAGAEANAESDQLYRIFNYDCPPLTKKAHNPITKKSIDFSQTPVAVFRFELFKELKHLRKVALRLGHLHDAGTWTIRPRQTKELLNGGMTIASLKDDDVYYDVRQKGVDMRIGMDIAAMSYRRLVNRMVLISGDADFIPAAKLARREGIDFVLDPMWNPIDDALLLHIDGIQTFSPRPVRKEPESPG